MRKLVLTVSFPFALIAILKNVQLLQVPGYINYTRNYNIFTGIYFK